MMMMDPPLCVVGCGPVGMISALALSQYCADENNPLLLIGLPPHHKDQRTTALLERSLSLLDSIGLRTAIEKCGTPLKTMRLIDDLKRLIRAPTLSFHSQEIDLEQFGYNCANINLNHVLFSAIKKNKNILHLDHKVTDFSQENNHVVLTLENGQHIQTQAVIAADGQNSFMRRQAGIATKERCFDQWALVSHICHEKTHHFISTEFHTPSGPFTLVPREGKFSSLVWVVKSGEAEKLLKKNKDDLEPLIEKCAHHILGAIDLKAPLQGWPLKTKLAKIYAKNRVFCVGEAAHCFAPLGAQGLNLGVRDAFELASCLSKPLRTKQDIGHQTLLDDYHKRRKNDIYLRAQGVDLLNQSLVSEHFLYSIGRGFTLFAASKSKAFRRYLMCQGL